MNPTPHGPRLLLVAALACAVLPAAARAQDPPLVVDAQGDDAFRYVLKYAGLTPLNRIGDLNDVPPEETVVIIFGNLGCLQQLKQFPGGLRGFVNRGGALLIASDQPDNLELGAFGVVFNGTGVRMPVQVTDVNPPNALEPHKELTFGFGEPIHAHVVERRRVARQRLAALIPLVVGKLVQLVAVLVGADHVLIQVARAEHPQVVLHARVAHIDRTPTARAPGLVAVCVLE